jgi:VacB/RNase II family 3'-5' exoribonuclease
MDRSFEDNGLPSHADTAALILQRIARQAMLERGFLTDFSREALAELETITRPSWEASDTPRDLRRLLWCSIDNDDSLDLDQLTVAESLPGGSIKVFVAVADVDGTVHKDSAIDTHARHNTTSVYTPALVFHMLPEKLSTGLTSLNANEDRPALVIESLIGGDGSAQGADIYRAVVHNYAKLAYNSLAPWLEGSAPMPGKVASVPGLAENLLLQDRVAQKLKSFRHEQGALVLETIEARAVFHQDELQGLKVEKKNRAKALIEDFMIASNTATATYLRAQGLPSLKRVVRSPRRWERIVEIAAGLGTALPPQPDAPALQQFLTKQRASDPLRFPDLSLTIVKLMGPGEYVAEFPGQDSGGHFGLALKSYAHSTAPNRRYPDLVTQRLLKAALDRKPTPYGPEELEELAAHCTARENAAEKVERQVTKSAAAMLLGPRTGELFDAIVTGASPKGTWVRLLNPPVEGRLVEGYKGMDVGHRLLVQLVHTDVERGFIDFRKAGG